jgi:hypothetical protein
MSTALGSTNCRSGMLLKGDASSWSDPGRLVSRVQPPGAPGHVGPFPPRARSDLGAHEEAPKRSTLMRAEAMPAVSTSAVVASAKPFEPQT